MISDITDICMVSLQYGFSCGFSDYYLDQMISDITDICMVSLQYGFSCGFSDNNPVQMISDITDICMVSLQYGFSYVFSVYYVEQMISDITDICMVFLQYGFSCLFSDDYLEQSTSNVSGTRLHGIHTCTVNKALQQLISHITEFRMFSCRSQLGDFLINRPSQMISLRSKIMLFVFMHLLKTTFGTY